MTHPDPRIEVDVREALAPMVDGMKRLRRERDLYRRALEEIARRDYRGNSSVEQDIANQALTEADCGR